MTYVSVPKDSKPKLVRNHFSMINKCQVKHDRLPIVCFAGCDWWYHNRGLFCTQVMTRLAKDFRVLFINSLGMRVPSLRKDRSAAEKITRKLKSISHLVRKVSNGMYVFSPISLPFFGSRAGRRLNRSTIFVQVRLVMAALGFTKPIFYIACPPAYEAVKKIERRYLIYGRTDLFEEMPGVNKSYIAALDEELTRSADLVLYVNSGLWRRGIDKNKNSLLIGHGVDFDLFAGAAKSEHIPGDIAAIPRPIIGFFGDISEKTIDMALVEFVAEKLPDMSLVFAGSISADVHRLRRLHNVYLLGQKPYNQIPLYGKEFDVAIMPWNKSKWIRFCNPVKIKEYLALGKPVVSTYYPEIEPYTDLVYIARDYDAFITCIHKAIQEDNQAKVEERRKRVQNETWDNKVAQIKAFIERDLS